jgi:predicted nucleic acid-binding protein
MAQFLLDTSVIVDVLNNKRGRPALLRELLEGDHVLACCAINVTEIYTGMRPAEETATQRFVESLRYYPVSLSAARLAGEIKREQARRGRTLNLGDVIIAAVAIHHNLTLMTDNVKDFPLQELQLYPLP